MKPEQKAEALRLADALDIYSTWTTAPIVHQTATLLRTLAAKEQGEIPDCGEAGHAEGRCGNAACMVNALAIPHTLADSADG